MSKWIEVHADCDGEHDEKTPGPYEHTISLDGGKPVLLDLCESHQELIDQLEGLLARGAPVAEGKAKKKPKPSVTEQPQPAVVGRELPPTNVPRRPKVSDGPVRGRPPADAPKPYTCVVCGKPSVSRAGLGVHVKTFHDMTLGEYLQRYPRGADPA